MKEPEIESFAKMVRVMREKQKDYFKTKNMAVLEESKKLERLVDLRVEQILDNQLRLFGEG